MPLSFRIRSSPPVSDTPKFPSKPLLGTDPIRLSATSTTDTDPPVWVSLIVTPASPMPNSSATFGTEAHWCLSWPGTPGFYDRKPAECWLHNSDELDPTSPCGALDAYIQRKHSERVICRITKMNARQLDRLEILAMKLPVQGSSASCQAWCQKLMERACQEGLLTRQEIISALYQATCLSPRF